jgi:hypothetical protein
LDPNIPAFQLIKNGYSEWHPDKSAYESITAAGKIVLQITPAHSFESIAENRNYNLTHNPTRADEQVDDTINKIARQSTPTARLNLPKKSNILTTTVMIIKMVVTVQSTFKLNNVPHKKQMQYSTLFRTYSRANTVVIKTFYIQME